MLYPLEVIMIIITHISFHELFHKDTLFQVAELIRSGNLKSADSHRFVTLDARSWRYFQSVQPSLGRIHVWSRNAGIC